MNTDSHEEQTEVKINLMEEVQNLKSNSAIPLHSRLKDLLKGVIESKKFGVNTRLPTEKELCERFGISRITVRQAFSGLVNEGFLIRIPGKGTFVSGWDNNEGWKRRLPNQDTGLIKLFVPPTFLFSTQDFFFSQLTKGTQKVIGNAGYQLVLSDERKKNKSNRTFQMTFRTHYVKGIIFLDPQINDPYIGMAIHQNIPHIVIGKYIGECETYSVDVDNMNSMIQVVEYLISLNHRRIGLINPPKTLTISSDFLEGYQRALNKHQLLYDPDMLVNTDFKITAGYEAMKKLLTLPNRPTAVIAGDDLMAAGALQVAREEGLRTPGDISVVGHNDIPLAAHTNPPLTTVRVPINQLGETSAQMLLKIISGEKVEQHICLPSELIIRDSTGPRTASSSSKKQMNSHCISKV